MDSHFPQRNLWKGWKKTLLNRMSRQTGIKCVKAADLALLATSRSSSESSALFFEFNHRWIPCTNTRPNSLPPVFFVPSSKVFRGEQALRWTHTCWFIPCDNWMEAAVLNELTGSDWRLHVRAIMWCPFGGITKRCYRATEPVCVCVCMCVCACSVRLVVTPWDLTQERCFAQGVGHRTHGARLPYSIDYFAAFEKGAK